MLPSIRIGTRHVLGLRPCASGRCLTARLHARSAVIATRCCENKIARRFQSLAVRDHDVQAHLDTSSLHVRESHAVTRSEEAAFAKVLPIVCPGCGALSQTVESNAPGYFSRLKEKNASAKERNENEVFQDAMKRLEKPGSASGDQSRIDVEQIQRQQSSEFDFTSAIARSVCDRCHDLVHQSKGLSIVHPSMESVRDMIEASPHARNHIYHVVDAADFPMSLIPNLVSSLDLPKLRTQNRRSKSARYAKGRAADVSFVITRADLLAPRKEQVDNMMPYLQDILRDALGRSGKNVRLGNVRCVSAKRGWWTPTVKQEIWDRGGAGWVVGKVNVGKSALFEAVFPKGRSHSSEEAAKLAAVRTGSRASSPPFTEKESESEMSSIQPDMTESGISVLDALEMNSTNKTAPQASKSSDNTLRVDEEGEIEEEEDLLDDNDDAIILPPARPETQYPQMPVVSALPGTTASPIRIPFGKGKGELIDLPGIQRSSLETHVRLEEQSSLIMKSRVVPDQYTLTPGRSLLIGGMIRITPKTDDLTFLAYPFTPLHAHVTGTQKAIAIQTGVQEDGTSYAGNISNIATNTAKQRMKSAGTFQLEWNVTKLRSGPLTAKDAGGMKPENLPFTIYSADILIESVGWVELICQVRNRKQHSNDGFPFSDPVYPEVEVFTPKGKFIAVRKPMNAWVVGGPKKTPKHARKLRPRMSISMHRRREGGKLGGSKTSFVSPD